MTLRIDIYPPSTSRVYLGHTFPALFDPISLNYGDRRLLRASSSIGRRFDLFTNDSAVANTSNHTFLIHNEDNWFGEETLFPSGHKNARVDVYFNGTRVWQGIVRDAVIRREQQHIELRAEDVLSRVLRLPFGLPVDLQQQAYDLASENVVVRPVYTNLYTTLQTILGLQTTVDATGGPTVASGYLSAQYMAVGVGMTTWQRALLSNAQLTLNDNERSTFRQRLLPLLSALGLALVPSYSDPGRVFLVAAKRGGQDVFNLETEIDYNRFPLITDGDVKAGSYRETPAEAQVINALRLKLHGLDDEVFYRGKEASGSRVNLSRLEFGERIPPTFDFSLFAGERTLTADGEFSSLGTDLSNWLDFLLEMRAFGARRCEFAISLDRLEEVLGRGDSSLGAPIIPFRHAFRLDLWFNHVDTSPLARLVVCGWHSLALRPERAYTLS